MSAQASSRSYGPSALGGGARRFVELTMTLARSEFKLRYFGSVLGYVWSLMRPLLFFGVLYLFFTQIIRFGAGVPHYGVYLLTGVVFWNFMAESTSGAVTCLVTREALLRKIRFPRMVIPLSVCLTSTFNLGMNAIAVFVFALLNGVTPTVRWLEMIPIAVAFILFATGIAMLLSAAYVRYRDVMPIWEVLLQAWFYCSPIMYVASSFGTRFGTTFAHFALINPVAMLLTQMGHAFIGGSRFPAAISVGGVPLGGGGHRDHGDRVPLGAGLLHPRGPPGRGEPLVPAYPVGPRAGAGPAPRETDTDPAGGDLGRARRPP